MSRREAKAAYAPKKSPKRRRRKIPKWLRPPGHDRVYAIMSGSARDPRAHLMRAATSLVSPAFRAAVFSRNTLHNVGVIGGRDLGRPTISVGNLTTGGTGKTPIVIALAHRLQAMGHRPAVLLRGYEPAGFESKKGSDEAAVLRGALGEDVPVMPDRKRTRGAAAVLEKHPEVTVFLLDDGFQHRAAKRDLNLVLIDATRPFGFGRLLPRGLMREPIGALRRADAVILTRVNRVEPARLTEIAQRIEKVTGRPPLAHAQHDWTTLRLAYKSYPLDRLRRFTALGVAGIGNPADFEQRLRQLAGGCVGCLIFDDHFLYERSDLSGIFNTALERGADAVVTTEKDWVKWRRSAHGVKIKIPVFRPVVEMKFVRGEEALDALLQQTFDQLPAPDNEA
ncbi:MAG: tetraacyldisaccharide 4'-kinase [Planctomycetota bacterium]